MDFVNFIIIEIEILQCAANMMIASKEGTLSSYLTELIDNYKLLTSEASLKMNDWLLFVHLHRGCCTDPGKWMNWQDSYLFSQPTPDEEFLSIA